MLGREGFLEEVGVFLSSEGCEDLGKVARKWELFTLWEGEEVGNSVPPGRIGKPGQGTSRKVCLGTWGT